MLRSEKKNKTVTLCAAARTGDIRTLERASKTALNWSDDEAMTPAMWSSARGQLHALRVIIERGYVRYKCFWFISELNFCMLLQKWNANNYYRVTLC